MTDRRHIVLISCVKSKQTKPAPAGELYTSTWFRSALAYARSLAPDLILILSAKHGVLGLEQTAAPYECTLKTASESTRRQWAENVLAELRRRTDLDHDEFTVLAGQPYREFIVPFIKHYRVPMEGLRQGEQLHYLRERATGPSDRPITEGKDSVCGRAHRLARALPRVQFPFDPSQLPSNGLYILFEHGEYGHGGDRIVRVGTHTGQGNLPARLLEHSVTPNKDRSIFRKNIGRALLAERADPFLAQWNQCLTTRDARERFGASLDRVKLKSVEAEVTDCITKRFTFAIIPVAEKDERLTLESGLIASIAQCGRCKPSQSWLGHHSPRPKIRRYGLWQEQHVKGAVLACLPVSLAGIKGTPGAPGSSASVVH